MFPSVCDGVEVWRRVTLTQVVRPNVRDALHYRLSFLLQGVSRNLSCGTVDAKKRLRAQISSSSMCSKQAFKQTKLSQEEAMKHTLLLPSTGLSCEEIALEVGVHVNTAQRTCKKGNAARKRYKTRKTTLDGKCQASHHQNIERCTSGTWGSRGAGENE